MKVGKNLLQTMQKGGKLIFIRHAYAPGGGDPDNFDIKDCTTQRNLSDSGRVQSQKIGNFFKKNKISIGKVYSSEWCRCKETAFIAFKEYETKNFLNSFFSTKFANNRKKQIIDFDKFLYRICSIIVKNMILSINLLSFLLFLQIKNNKFSISF
mgnify:CR=1 FL=1